jgi:DNA polymerase elongation subunit (family B)
MPRPVVAVDIETVGQDWESLAPRVQEYLVESQRGDAGEEAAKERLGLHVATGRIVAIGLWDQGAATGRVLIEGDAPDWAPFGDGARIFRAGEPAMLREFWNALALESPLVVTFNGRAFDAPYIMVRSAILGVPPSRNLMGPRYQLSNHCDLYDVLTFWNASRMRGPLEFWCRQFGLASPKDGMRGSQVGAMYRDGRLDEIARYCLDDARATAQLYERLRPTIALLDSGTAL